MRHGDDQLLAGDRGASADAARRSGDFRAGKTGLDGSSVACAKAPVVHTPTIESIAMKFASFRISEPLVMRYDSFCLLIRKLFPTTLTLEIAMAPAATIGLRSPNAASGIAATL